MVRKYLNKIVLLILSIALTGCISNGHLSPAHYFKHRVQSGESLQTIASKYYIPWQVIWGVNKLKNPHQLEVGQILKIPVTKDAMADRRLRQSANLVQGPQRRAGLFFSGSSFSWPVRGKVSSFFGMRNGRPHEGIDIKANRGDPILAAKGGVIEFVGWKRGYGRTIVINHGKMKTLYAHLSAFKVRRKQRVIRGQKIGLVGASGNAQGYHLHFEIRDSNKAFDPISFLSTSQNSS